MNGVNSIASGTHSVSFVFCCGRMKVDDGGGGEEEEEENSGGDGGTC